jgi:para-nitrobenzyl esterase
MPYSNIQLKIQPVKGVLRLVLASVALLLTVNLHAASITPLVQIEQGRLQGAFDDTTQLNIFKGVPFASPPVGELRWRPPQQVASWQGVKTAGAFANQCMQLPLFSDMKFRSAGVSEDCLYLNVWTPSIKADEALPVLLYFYGGGFAAGDGSEARYDGASMAQQDIVVITANYRLGVFGLLSHPELSAEADYGGSGNYTFMDQAAALQWVVDNVDKFGGDPSRITIAGESAGSMSVNALMVSELSKHNIAGAIGESGSLLGPTLGPIPLHEAQVFGQNMAKALGLDNEPLSINELREMPAQQLLEASTKKGFQWFMPTTDGYVFERSALALYQNNQFADIPLLAGNNTQEGGMGRILGDMQPTLDNYKKALKKIYPENHEEVFSLYPASSQTEVMDAAQALASDRYISFSTWNWADYVAQHGQQNVYFYAFSKIRPASIDAPKGQSSGNRGAVHSAEIEYALGNLNANPIYQWQDDDFVVSEIMQAYFAAFIKSGNPNTPNLPKWPLFKDNQQLNINENPTVEDISNLRKRYAFHRQYYQMK